MSENKKIAIVSPYLSVITLSVSGLKSPIKRQRLIYWVPKMVEYKEPQFTSSHGNTKITTIFQTTINEKDENLPEKIFYN